MVLNLTGNKANIYGGKISSTSFDRNILQVEVSMAQDTQLEGFAVYINNPEVARYISALFEQAAKQLENNQ